MMNKLTNIFTLIVILVIIVIFGINPNGQCGEGPTGSLLFKDYVEYVRPDYSVNVCKYYNTGGLTLTAQEFCYLPEVINGWYRMYSTHINQAGTYVCKIDWNVEGHWNTPIAPNPTETNWNTPNAPENFRGSN
jgi:hypothetical protein